MNVKPRATGWALALLATHAAVFLIAGGGTTRNAVEPAPAASVAAAKSMLRVDPAPGLTHRLALADLEKSPLSRKEFLALRNELFRDWVKRDLRGAMDMIYGLDSRERLMDLEEEIHEDLEAAIAGQADEVWQWIESGRYGSNWEAVGKRWIHALAADRQWEKLLAAMRRPSALFDRALAADLICERGTAEDIERLRATLAAPKAPAEGKSFRGRWVFRLGQRLEYSTRMVELNADRMPEVLAGETDKYLQEDMVRAWAEDDLSKRSAAEALALLAKLPEDLGQIGLRLLFYDSCHEGGCKALVDLLEANAPRQLWQGIEPEELRMGLSDLRNFSYCLPAEMCRELARISDPEMRQSLFGRAGWEFNPKYHEAEVREALAAMAPGDDRDAFIGGLLGNDDLPENIFGDLVGQISDEDWKQELLKEHAEEAVEKP